MTLNPVDIIITRAYVVEVGLSQSLGNQPAGTYTVCFARLNDNVYDYVC